MVAPITLTTDTTDFPMVKDIRAYQQGMSFIMDERTKAYDKRSDFLTPDEEMWYRLMYEKYQKEFGFV